MPDPIVVKVDARPPPERSETPIPAKGATTTTAPIVPKPVEDPAKPDANSARFAQLAKIEARNRQAQRELKAAEAELEARARKVLDQEKLYAEVRTNPTRLKDVLGDDYYTRITEAQLNGGKVPPEVLAQQALEEARAAKEETHKQLDEFKKAQAAQVQEQMTQNIDNYGTALLESAAADPVTYKAINTLRAEGVDLKQTLLSLQYGHLEKTGRILSDSDALGLVEKYYRSLAAKIGGIQEVAEQAKAPEKLAQPPRASQPSRSAPQGTLSNGLTSAPTLPASPRPKTAYERALAAMEAVAAARNTNG